MTQRIPAVLGAPDTHPPTLRAPPIWRLLPPTRNSRSRDGFNVPVPLHRVYPQGHKHLACPVKTPCVGTPNQSSHAGGTASPRFCRASWTANSELSNDARACVSTTGAASGVAHLATRRIRESVPAERQEASIINSPPTSDLARRAIQECRRSTNSPIASLATRIVAASAASVALVMMNVKTGSNPPPRSRLTFRNPALTSSSANCSGTRTLTASSMRTTVAHTERVNVTLKVTGT